MSFVPMYVCIILTSPFNLYFLLFSCLYGNSSSSWLEKSFCLLEHVFGKENPIMTVASCLLGHHISQRLRTCWCMENWLKHLCLLVHFLSLFSISLRRFWCHNVFCVCLSWFCGRFQHWGPGWWQFLFIFCHTLVQFGDICEHWWRLLYLPIDLGLKLRAIFSRDFGVIHL